MGAEAFCMVLAFTEIAGFFYIPEINAPYVQSNAGRPPGPNPPFWKGNCYELHGSGGHNQLLSRDTDYVFV
jgi:hypothetical protein